MIKVWPQSQLPSDASVAKKHQRELERRHFGRAVDRHGQTWRERGRKPLHRRGGFCCIRLAIKYQNGSQRYSPFTAGLRNQFSKVPESSSFKDLPCAGVTLRGPFRSESQRRTGAQFFVLRNQNDALFFESFIRVLEGLLVDSLEVGKIALVI